MQAAFFEQNDPKHVAKVCGVHYRTALKYCQEGDKTTGRPSLQSLLDKHNATKAQVAAKSLAYSLEAATADTLKLTRAAKAVLARQLQSMSKPTCTVCGQGGEHFRNPAEILKAIHHIEAASLGGATDVLRLQGQEAAPDPMAGLEDDEVIQFVEVGMAVLRMHRGVVLALPDASATL